MIADLWMVAQQVLTLFILIGVGVFCQKARVLNDNAVKNLANLVLYFATPCVIISSCAREFDAGLLKGFLVVIAAALVNHFILIGIAHAVFRDKEESRRRVLRFSTIFSNAGYMAIPLQQAILGPTGVFYCAAYVIVFNIIVWTYGVVCMSGDRKELSLRRLVVNPGIIGVLIGLVVFICRIPVPGVVLSAVQHVGNLNPPIPMIIVGYYLGQTNLLAALRDRRGYVCLAIRLLAMPALALGLLLLCQVRGDLLTSIMICVATPVATACTMFATRYECNPLLSVNLVSLSTLLSILTMPVFIAVTKYLGSVL